MFYGAGAGAFPTASAVVGDVLALADAMTRGGAPLPEPEPVQRTLAIRPIEELEAGYYIRLALDGRPDALDAAVATLAAGGVPVQRAERVDAGAAVVITDICVEGALNTAVDALARDLGDTAVASVIRIEDVAAWSKGACAN